MPHNTLVVYLNRQYFVNNTLENVSNYLNPVLHGSSGRILKANSEILWTPDSKSWLTGKDPDAGKDWRQEEKGMTDSWMVSPTQWTWVWASPGRWWRTGKPGVLYSPWGHKSWIWLSDWATTIVKSLCTPTNHIYYCLPFMKISSSSMVVYSLESLNFNFIYQDASTLSLIASAVYYFNWIWHNTFLKSFTLGAYNLAYNMNPTVDITRNFYFYKNI